MKHKARKRFGQNFLVDGRVIEQLVAAIAPQAGELIFEIGPGRQALTAPLVATGVELVVVEIDRDLAASLANDPAGYEVLNQDALQVDFAGLGGGRPYRLVGNLPYNISTPLLFHALGQQPPPRDMHFMLQQEVVQRMAAGPGSRAYGRLSLTCQNHCQVVPLLDVPPQAFEPPPRVQSSFVRLLPRAAPRVPPELQDNFDRLVAAAFAQRRKTLRNSLRQLLDPSDFESSGIDASLRPEQLGIDDFIALARVLDGSST